MSKIIGIDLGTSNSAAAVVEGGNPAMIPAAEGTVTGGGKAFPSYVAITKDGERLVGEPARRQAVTNSESTVTAFKRKMGTREKYTLQGKEYTPEQLSAFILQKIKSDAEGYLGEEVKKAVITVPAYFDDSQRQATKDAGKIAGLEVERIINEPTAAALAYGLDKTGKEENVLVFDFGGGTLDVTVMEMYYVEEEKASGFEVKSTAGDTNLGGEDMDKVLLDYVAEDFKKENGVDLRDDKNSYARLKEAVEKAKIELSSTKETEINLPYITADQSGPKHLQMKINRAKLEELVNPIIEKCRPSIDQALKDAGLTAENIQKVILVGGPTRMPAVQEFINNYVGRKIEHGIDPSECVAKGAAIQGASLGGEMKDLQLLDVTPLTLGIETLGGVMTPLIERNTTIPTSKSQVFSTAADNQTSVDIHILQGERPMAADNKSLGRFILEGIPPAPKGVPQIEVTFDIDANGILNVKAQDKASGKEQSITITGSSNLSDDEIEKMKQEAEKNAEEDKKRKEKIEVKNQADTLISTTEKTLKEAGDKVKAEDKQEVESKLEELKKVKDGEDMEAIKKATEDLSQAIQKIGSQMYQQQQAQGGQTDSGESQQDQAQANNTDNAQQEGEDESDKSTEQTKEGEYEEADKQ